MSMARISVSARIAKSSARRDCHRAALISLAPSRIRVTGDSDVWVEGLTQQTRVRITTSRDLDLTPVWSPDGRHLAYRSGPFGASNLSIASSDGTGVVKVLPCPGEPCHPTDWSPDGQWLALNARADVWRVEIEGGSASPLLNGPFVEHDAADLPDGRWIAYVSTESGQSEVYIRTLSAPVRRVVASSGGNQPVWRRDGRALFYVSLDNQLHEVPVQREEDGSPAIGASVKLPVRTIRRQPYRHYLRCVA